MVTHSATETKTTAKTKILAAATQAFVALGPAGARVDAIAAAAGVNKRMLYHYFGDKQGLYQAVLEASNADPDKLSAHRARLLAWEGLLETGANGDAKVRAGAATDGRLEGDIEPLPEALGKRASDAQMFLLLRRALEVFPHVFGPEVERITGLAPEGEAFNVALERLADQVQLLDPSRQVQPPRIEAKAKVRLRARSKPRPATA